jgi:hypothetical protein
MEELLRYFMTETNDRLERMESRLEDLTKFKLEMIASARLTSLIVSGICGAITLVASLFVAIKTAGK